MTLMNRDPYIPVKDSYDYKLYSFADYGKKPNDIMNRTYIRLFERMLKMDFIVKVNMDKNRAIDGINLRTSFSYIYDAAHPSYPLENDNCSVLEMLIALSIRCEDSIMGNPGSDNPQRWFWIMLGNLGLLAYDDNNYCQADVDYILCRFLLREYEPNGLGGLFPLMLTDRDQRDVEIWNQLAEYINELYPIEETIYE